MSDEPKSGLSLPQILAGALASASAAVASSWLGVAGTVIGAAVMSVIASVGAVLYQRPIERSHERLRSAIPVLPSTAAAPRTGGSTGTAVMSGSGDTTELPAVTDTSALAESTGGVAVAVHEHDDAAWFDDDTSVLPEAGSPDEPSAVPGSSWKERVPWRRVAIGAAAMLLMGLALLTGLELLTGQAVSVTGGGRDRAPSLVQLIRGDDSSDGTGSSGTRTGSGDGDADVRDNGGAVTSEPTDGTSSEPATAQPMEEPQPTTEPTQPSEPTPTQPSETQPSPTEPSPSEATPTDSVGSEAPVVDDDAAATASSGS